MFALFGFIVYYNLMTLGQSWVGAGRLGLASFMVLLHGGMLAVSLLVLAVRHNQWTVRHLLSAPTDPASPATGRAVSRMKTIRRLIHREALSAVTFVTVGFLALFFFFDMVDELRWVGRTGAEGYQLSHALLFVVLSIPSHLYELLPITVLIGTIFVMARLAQSSEFTIMRTSGMGPWRALRTLVTLGGVFVVLTFAVGDYLAFHRPHRPAYQGTLPRQTDHRRHRCLAQGAAGQPLLCRERARAHAQRRHAGCAHLRVR